MQEEARSGDCKEWGLQGVGTARSGDCKEWGLQGVGTARSGDCKEGGLQGGGTARSSHDMLYARIATGYYYMVRTTTHVCAAHPLDTLPGHPPWTPPLDTPSGHTSS